MSKIVFPLSAILVLAAIMPAPAAQITTLVASDSLKASADTLRTGTGVSKRIQVPYGGKVRVRFDMAAAAGSTNPATCSISNDDAIFQTTNTTFQNHVIDVPVEARGVVHIVCSGGFQSTPSLEIKNVRLRNFRVFYDITNKSDNPVIVQN